MGTGRPALSMKAQEIGPGESPREAYMEHIASPLNCTPGPNLQTANVGTQGHQRTPKTKEHTGSHLQGSNADGTVWPKTF